MKAYEAEARFFVDEKFKEKLEKMGFKVVYPYSFEDAFYCPKGGWSEEGKTLRIRDWGDKCEILFTHVDKFKFRDLEFKRSRYKEGKVKLYEGSREECEELLRDMEFEECGRVKKEEGYIMSNGEFEVALEKIDGKWVLEVEVEGGDPEEAYRRMRYIMKFLGLKDPTSKSTYELFSSTSTRRPS
ncbi:MAG: hypothetical protein GXO07_03095 [Crenarchaeota archaeon]|nr:hypothetical protein [Thermoproteota archaeon]